MGLQEPANINKSVYPKEYQILYKNPIPQKFIATKLASYIIKGLDVK